MNLRSMVSLAKEDEVRGSGNFYSTGNCCSSPIHPGLGCSLIVCTVWWLLLLEDMIQTRIFCMRKEGREDEDDELRVAVSKNLRSSLRNSRLS